MLLLFAHGVLGGRISPSRFVALTSANPACLFGLWPRKGNLQLGSDADLVIMDPRGDTLISHPQLHDNGDYSPYEGMRCPGQIRLTLSRGEIVARDGEFTGQRGHGRFLARAPFDPELAPDRYSPCPAVAG
jgi:dihydropyrimidinase